MQTAIKWLGLICVVTGAILTSMVLTPFNMIAFNTGSFLYTVWGLLARDYNIALVNALLITIYSIGIFIHV